ncbi:hypothetical protein X801_03369, partial [Opisthorchis viverrini]
MVIALSFNRINVKVIFDCLKWIKQAWVSAPTGLLVRRMANSLRAVLSVTTTDGILPCLAAGNKIPQEYEQGTLSLEKSTKQTKGLRKLLMHQDSTLSSESASTRQ